MSSEVEVLMGASSVPPEALKASEALRSRMPRKRSTAWLALVSSATYSTVRSFADLDKTGTTIITAIGGAYSLWLERNVQHATLVQDTGTAVKERFVAEGLDAMAGLRPALVKDDLLSDGYTVMPGHYGMVEQATGVPKEKGPEAFEWLRDWIEEVKANGLVESLISDFGVEGNLLVAPAAKL